MNVGYKDSPLGKIPSDWEAIKIEEILEEYQNGYAFSAKGYVEEGIPIISMAMISLEGRFQFNSLKCKRWNPLEALNLKRYILHKGDLIIAMTDVTPNKDLIGKMAVINIDGEFLLNQRVGWLKLKNELINTQYLSYIGNSESWLRNCRNMASQGAQANIGTKQIAESFIPLPPLPEQQKIAEILSTVDAKIEVIDQQISETQALKKGLMQRLLTKGIGHTEFKDSALGEIPKSWEVVELSDIAKCTVGIATSTTHAYCENGVLLLRNQNIKEGKIALKDVLYITPEFDELNKSKRLREDDIITVRTGYPGISAVVPKELEGSQSFTTLIIRRESEKILSKFLCYYINSEKGKSFFQSNQAGGGQQNVGSKTLESMKIIVPTFSEQTQIASILSSADDKLEVLSEKKTHYQELKQGLMQQLLTGKIRVKNLIDNKVIS